MIIQLQKSTVILSILIAACLVVLIVTTIYCKVFSQASKEIEMDPPDVLAYLPPSKYEMGQYTRGAVVSNSAPCAEIGKKILNKYGSAVDAAIATLICDGVGCLQNMGLGGGFLMTVYIKSKSQAYALNARETAPAASSKDMFNGNPKLAQYGGLSVGVPGELKGYQEAYAKFGGKAPWRELFEDTIELCKTGIPVNKHLDNSLRNYESEIMESPGLKSMLLDENGKLPKLGDIIKLPKLAETLQIVSDQGPDALYNGSLTKGFVQDIKDGGGIITEEDLHNYSVRWEEPISLNISGGLKFYSSPLPGSGPLLGYMLQVLDGFIPTGNSLTDTQRITETFKFAYGRRTELGDPYFENVTQVLSDLSSAKYIGITRDQISDHRTHQDAKWYGAHFYSPEDHGTANIVVVAPNGDAVAATSTINLVFGSKLVSKSTGIILNNEMDDFSAPKITNYFGVPPSPSNFIAPGKRPMSSMCPTIIVNSDGDVRLVIGAAGGTKITTSTALASIWNLWYNKTIKESIDYPRFHHQLWPMSWQYEYGTLKEAINFMKSVGHKPVRLGSTWRSSVTAISNVSSLLTAVPDYRRPGGTAGLV